MKLSSVHIGASMLGLTLADPAAWLEKKQAAPDLPQSGANYGYGPPAYGYSPPPTVNSSTSSPVTGTSTFTSSVDPVAISNSSGIITRTSSTSSFPGTSPISRTTTIVITETFVINSTVTRVLPDPYTSPNGTSSTPASPVTVTSSIPPYDGPTYSPVSYGFPAKNSTGTASGSKGTVPLSTGTHSTPVSPATTSNVTSSLPTYPPSSYPSRSYSFFAENRTRLHHYGSGTAPPLHGPSSSTPVAPVGNANTTSRIPTFPPAPYHPHPYSFPAGNMTRTYPGSSGTAPPSSGLSSTPISPVSASNSTSSSIPTLPPTFYAPYYHSYPAGNETRTNYGSSGTAPPGTGSTPVSPVTATNSSTAYRPSLPCIESSTTGNGTGAVRSSSTSTTSLPTYSFPAYNGTGGFSSAGTGTAPVDPARTTSSDHVVTKTVPLTTVYITVYSASTPVSPVTISNSSSSTPVGPVSESTSFVTSIISSFTVPLSHTSVTSSGTGPVGTNTPYPYPPTGRRYNAFAPSPTYYGSGKQSHPGWLARFGWRRGV